MNHILGEKIAHTRKTRGLTQEKLAARLNVSRQCISHWEKGDSQPNYEMLVRLVQVLEMDVDDLLARK